MKKCSICKQLKPIHEFHSNGLTSGGSKKIKPNCAKCEMDFRKNRTWEIIAKYMHLRCVSCEYDRTREGLDLHHLDASKKEFTIKRLDYRAENKIVAELKNVPCCVQHVIERCTQGC